MNLLDLHSGACRLYCGSALEVLRSLPAESVDCCITSPPYYGLRAYGTEPQIWGGDQACAHEFETVIKAAANGILHPAGMSGETLSETSATRKPTASGVCRLCGAWRGELGLEPTLALFIDHLVSVFAEVWRVLKKDGTLWVNIGDSYSGSWGAQSRGNLTGEASSSLQGTSPLSARQIAVHPQGASRTGSPKAPGMKPKDLMMVPARLAIALQDWGWYLRQDIIWAKPQAMPESVADRCTRAHEYIFLLSKSKKYFFDGAAIAEPCVSGESDLRKMRESQERIGGKHKTLDDPMVMASSATNIGQKRSVGGKPIGRAGGVPGQYPQSAVRTLNADSSEQSETEELRVSEEAPLFRNKRSVWSIATAAFKGAHFATFPEALVEPMVLAGCKGGGDCA